MAILTYDDATMKKYHSGIDRGVLFQRDGTGAYPLGVAWNGLIGITQSPEGAEPTDLYANNVKYATLMSSEQIAGSIEAYTFPDEFMACDGTLEVETGVSIRQQTRVPFALAYRQRIGSDAGGDEIGHQIHILVGCRATPSELAANTINDSPEAVTFSWDFTTTPVGTGDGNHNPTAALVIDTTKCTAGFLTYIEEALWGSVGADPALPTIEEIITQAGLL